MNTVPGVAVTDTITITNVGNVAENNVSLSATTSSGLTLTGLTPVNLAVGPVDDRDGHAHARRLDAAEHLLQATITATFGASASTQTLQTCPSTSSPRA